MRMLLVVAGRRNLLITSSSSFLADADLWHPLLHLKEVRHGHSSLAFTFWTKSLHSFFLHTMQRYSLVRGWVTTTAICRARSKHTSQHYLHYSLANFQYGCVLTLTSRRTVQKEMIWGVHSVKKCFFATGPWNTWTICNMHLQHSNKWGTAAAGRWDPCTICNMQYALAFAYQPCDMHL